MEGLPWALSGLALSLLAVYVGRSTSWLTTTQIAPWLSKIVGGIVIGGVVLSAIVAAAMVALAMLCAMVLLGLVVTCPR